MTVIVRVMLLML